MRVKSFVKFQVADDAELKQCLFARTEESLNVVTDDNQAECAHGVFTLAASAVDTEIDFQGVSTAKYIYLEGEGDFSYKLNADTNTPTNVALHEVAVGTSTARAFMTVNDATALFLSNPSSELTVKITYAIVGV